MPIISPRARLLSATALACGSLSIGASTARAACEPDPPANASVVTCSGSTDGYDAIPGRDLTVEVVSGAAMNSLPGSADNAAISFDNNNAGKTLLNEGNLNGNITAFDNRGDISVTHSGNANFGMTVNGTGTTTLVIDAGHSFSGPVSLEGASNTADNSGTFNNGLEATGSAFNDVTIRQGGQVNGTFSLTGDGQNRVDNSGIVNNGLVLDGDGEGVVFNRANATINGDLSSTGTSADYVDNFGLFNNRILTGDGDGTVINRENATINGGVDQGDGVDSFTMLGGRINNDVQQGDGEDYAVVSGGVITGRVLAGDARDDLLWEGGKIGRIDMGAAQDVATFRGLTPSELEPGVRVDGGTEIDRLVWEGTTGSVVSRYVEREFFQLTDGSELTFDGTLTMGDSGTGTGALYIDPTSTVFAGDGTNALVPAQNDDLRGGTYNAGTIDVTNGGGRPQDSLRVRGRYYGADGQLILDTTLAGDGSPSDRLIVDGGGASGSTGIIVRNADGLGDLTTGDGILVVRAQNGAVTQSDALQPRPTGGRRTVRLPTLPRRLGSRYREQLVSAHTPPHAPCTACTASTAATTAAAATGAPTSASAAGTPASAAAFAAGAPITAAAATAGSAGAAQAAELSPGGLAVHGAADPGRDLRPRGARHLPRAHGGAALAREHTRRRPPAGHLDPADRLGRQLRGPRGRCPRR